VAAFDTELFGHWWYEGPEFLEAVLRMLPQAGVQLRTLAGARDAGLVAGRVELPESSWGAGKDWQVWDNDAVAELNDELVSIQKRLFAVLEERLGPSVLDGVRGGRDAGADQLAREAMLASSSDWAFMITRDSAASYAWQRARGHAQRFFALADALQGTDRAGTSALVGELRAVDGPFGHLDARTF
jgi:1,4-alpha-glucan branching enzyme